MIYGNLNNKECIEKLDDKIINAINYFLKNNIKDLGNGEHIIVENELFFNKIEYKTTTKENRFWEAHRKFIDLHIIIEGNERICVNLINNMKVIDYVETEDYVKVEGEEKIICNLEENDFLVLYPEDAHMTCLKVNNNESDVKKVVFKILV